MEYIFVIVHIQMYLHTVVNTVISHRVSLAAIRLMVGKRTRLSHKASLLVGLKEQVDSVFCMVCGWRLAAETTTE